MLVTTEIKKKAAGNKGKKKRVNSVLNKLLSFDQSIKDDYENIGGQLNIVGVDEVGIGCLAGPVVAAATILPVIIPKSKLAKELSKLNDSKKVNPEIRKELGYFIREHAHFAIASASVEEIDELNILQAGLLAMKRAVADLITKLTEAENIIVLVDGNKKIPQMSYKQMCLIQGDSRSASIAAASVIAKVFRDQVMEELSLSHPHYLWHRNKGYGSSRHRQAILAHGLSVHHRRSFTGNLVIEIEED